MKLSIVTTLYRSAGSIDEFYQRAMSAGERVANDIEMILVNDGSPDASLERALRIHAADSRVVVVDLARNFGHHKAMMTGLAHARGDLVFLVDSDLEEEPELIGEFHERMVKDDCDVVFGVQQSRRGSWVNRLGGAVFFWLMQKLSDRPQPRNWVTARLMKRDFVRALVRHRDREFLIGDLWELTGFRQIAVPVRKLSLSPTTYTFGMRVQMAVKHLTTSSTRLLSLILYVGAAVSALAVVVILYLVSRYFLFGTVANGWTSLIVSVWFFGGLTTLILGVLGIYLATILSESKRRPYTVVRRIHRAKDTATVARPGHLTTRRGRPDIGTRS